MKLSTNFYSRMLAAIPFAYAGYAFGTASSSSPPTDTQVWATHLLTLCGAALGLLLGPYLTIYPLRRLLLLIRTMPMSELLSRSIGMLAGLLAGVLLTMPLSHLPGRLGQYVPLVVAILLAYLGSAIISARKNDLLELLQAGRHAQPLRAGGQRVLVDTSIIVDGRILDVVKAGFITGSLLVPRFVLHELQRLADSGDEVTRAKGKRGLDLLRSLRESKQVDVIITDDDVANSREVDDKLVALARVENIPLLTNDVNLARVAQLQGVLVLNLNKLADALRTPFTVGDQISVVVRSEGREREQGVGFSDDGTMIVVEDARSLIGQEIRAIVTRVYTTQTGRIVFAELDRSKEQRRRA